MGKQTKSPLYSNGLHLYASFQSFSNVYNYYIFSLKKTQKRGPKSRLLCSASEVLQSQKKQGIMTELKRTQ